MRLYSRTKCANPEPALSILRIHCIGLRFHTLHYAKDFNSAHIARVLHRVDPAV